MLRLVQRQEELEEKYSTLKLNLKKKVKKNAENKLSKKDFLAYSKSLEANPRLGWNLSSSKLRLQSDESKH